VITGIAAVVTVAVDNVEVIFSTVNFDSNDFYVVNGNGDDSGNARYHKWLPAAFRTVRKLIDGRGFKAATGRKIGVPARIKRIFQRRRVNFDSNDFYVVNGNGDDSGNARYHKWLPAASLK
jgi:uncharacterized membrane-anchored protein